MTLVHFNLTDSYNKPSRGSLAFMPHRRHAANETEVLPKPVTIPLLNGEVTVNLQPNSSSWVWIITEYFEGVSKSFYTNIPDRDGVMEHTELIHISPSSLPAPYDAVEPAWWAEMRQYKTTVSDTLLQSGEALTEAQAAIDTGRESIERTQHNASVAGAYADESRQSSYDARDYRDEAEQWRNEAQEQADRAATGPESAATRAETAADRSETARDRSVIAEDESRVSAATATTAATTATTAATNSVNARTQAQAEADRSQSEANRAQGYADDLLAGPSTDADRAEAARDEAQHFRDEANTAALATQQHEENTEQYAISAETARDTTITARDEVVTALDALDTHEPWIELDLENGFTRHETYLRARRLNTGHIEVYGVVTGGTRDDGTDIAALPENMMPYRLFRETVVCGNDVLPITVNTNGVIRVQGDNYSSSAIYIHLFIY